MQLNCGILQLSEQKSVENQNIAKDAARKKIKCKIKSRCQSLHRLTMHTCGESKVNGTFHLDVSSFIVTTSAFVKKKNSKMRHLKKFVKPMEVNRTCIGFTNLL